jgi:hypothetical protein
VVLLGAGASAEAGVPTTQPMTESLVEAVNRSRSAGHPLAQALNFVCGALIAHDSAAGENPYTGPDVERVFAAVELLAKRHSLEVSPFVSSWHPTVDALDRRPDHHPGLFDSRLRDSVLEEESHNSAGRLIADLVESLTSAGPTGELYAELARLLVSELRDLIATTPKDTRYLDPLIEIGRGSRLAIATLNYDLTIEQAAERTGVGCTTGIHEWIADGAWQWPAEGIRLMKLHGSIDWAWEREEREHHLPVDVIRASAGPEDGYRRPALVFGQREKLRAEGPFLGLLAEFESHLRDAAELLVIGYSFRDEHVNELIRRWSWEECAQRITVVDPSWPGHFSGNWDDFRAQMQMHLDPTGAAETETPHRLEIRREGCGKALQRIGE